MTRPNPQGTPIPLEAQKPPGRILRPLREYRPIRHDPPPIDIGPEQAPNGHRTELADLYKSGDCISLCAQAHTSHCA
jgi:hypothetical protein